MESWFKAILDEKQSIERQLKEDLVDPYSQFLAVKLLSEGIPLPSWLSISESSEGMSSGTWSLEIESSAPAAQLFKAAMLDWHNLGPKLLPDILSSANCIEGNGGVGSIRQLNFTSAMPVPFAKERLDFIDNEKLECKNTLIEGGGIGSKLESASSFFKFNPKSNGSGCLVKVEATYKTLPGVVVADEIEKAKEGVSGVIKAAGAYLAANPTAYA